MTRQDEFDSILKGTTIEEVDAKSANVVRLKLSNGLIVELEAERNPIGVSTIVARTRSSDYNVWAVQWEESESGWGVRPDGFTLHVSLENAQEYIKEITAERSKDYAETERVPHSYSRVDGEPFKVSVTREVHQKIKEAKSGFLWGSPSGVIAEGRHGIVHIPERKTSWRHQ